MAFQSRLCRQMLARYHSCGTAARHLTRTPSFSRARSAWVQWCLVAPFLVMLIGLWADAAQAQPFAYISNNLSNNVSVIDTVTNTVVATVPVGTGPFGVAVNRAGTRVYVTNRESNTLSVIDTETNMVRATVPVGTGPFGVAVNPAGSRVYVANTSSNDVSVIDTETNTVVDTVGLPPPILMSGAWR
jgi:YVTN family beta-propeller protein